MDLLGEEGQHGPALSHQGHVVPPSRPRHLLHGPLPPLCTHGLHRQEEEDRAQVRRGGTSEATQ